MKAYIKRLLQRVASVSFRPVQNELTEHLDAMREAHATRSLTATEGILSQGSKAAQKLLLRSYMEMARGGEAYLSFNDVGFRCHSQFDEDGILLYVFGLLGMTNRVVVEVCAGDGIQCNSANLIINHGWWGFLFDGNPESVARGTEFYRRHPDTFLYPPRFRHAWITAENVDEVLAKAGVGGSVDLFSLDIDGMDYWVWERMTAIDPRVVICETQSIIPGERRLVAPYDPHFSIKTPDFYGASLAAMTAMANRKGYRLVGTHRYGFNAIYVKREIGSALLPEVSVESCQQDPYTRDDGVSRWAKVQHLEWVEV